MDFERRSRQTQQVPLTPLIDVVFLLIVFFMLSSNFVMSESLELVLPDAGSSSPEPSVTKHDTTRITIVREDLLYMDGEPLAQRLLNETMFSLIGGNPEENVIVETAKGVSVQQLVKVMDSVYMAGGKNLSIVKWVAPPPSLESVSVGTVRAPSDMDLGRVKAAPPKASPSGFLRLPK